MHPGWLVAVKSFVHALFLCGFVNSKLLWWFVWLHSASRVCTLLVKARELLMNSIAWAFFASCCFLVCTEGNCFHLFVFSEKNKARVVMMLELFHRTIIPYRVPLSVACFRIVVIDCQLAECVIPLLCSFALDFLCCETKPKCYLKPNSGSRIKTRRV